MRIRSMKPGFATSESLAQCRRDTRLHYAMLWMYLDDEGRGIDNPKLIKAAIWPLDDDIGPAEIEAMQAELEATGHIVRWLSTGHRYFAVPKFPVHQHPKRPIQSKIPEPPGQTQETGMHPQRTHSAPTTHPQGPPGEEGRGVGVGGEHSNEVSLRCGAETIRNIIWNDFTTVYGDPGNDKAKRKERGRAVTLVADALRTNGITDTNMPPDPIRRLRDVFTLRYPTASPPKAIGLAQLASELVHAAITGETATGDSQHARNIRALQTLRTGQTA